MSQPNKALQTARKKGYEAAKQGLAVSDCPYQDLRKESGKLTWSRAFRNAWLEGFCRFSEDNNGSRTC
ncbi:Rmf/CrpP family protein [Vibrio coralliilyticus]|uniref:Rmf/CrpP family protein n=1 Tax=Vibrio coralliilyticus TaxID=190893 RepID=UPI00148BCEDA|nr:Rmf/CrpP family protein [Vibrio coralliilyticus]NOI31892.1 hypothetical protein [Vibrio coralliilyticus]NOI51226.1 hypothetical protein [Vibrio coralliilyticus]